MKNLSILALACLMLCACSSQITEKDYRNALIEHVGADVINEESILLTHVRDITVADSVAYITHNLVQEYEQMLAEKKEAWEKKQADCEQDELANVLRHEDYMKKYNEAKRAYGNDIKYKNKIEGYLKAAQKLPSNHEEYLEFDRKRGYSFTRDAENLKAEYEQFQQDGLEKYAAQHPFITQYNERVENEVVGVVYNITYTTQAGESVSADYVFTHNPVVAIEELNHDACNIINYNVCEEAPEEVVEE